LVDALRVVVRLQQERRDGADQDGLGHPPGAVDAQAPGYLPGAHREPGEDHVGQVQVVDQRLEIGGEGVGSLP
jgi:hypothetical protein